VLQAGAGVAQALQGGHRRAHLARARLPQQRVERHGHRLQRAAQVVGHHRRELLAHPLELLEGGKVLEGDHGAEHGARLRAHRRGADEGRQDRPVGALDAHLLVVHHLARQRAGRREALEGDGAAVGVLQEVAAPHRTLGGQAQHRARGLVAEGDDVVGDHEEDAVRGLAQDRAEQAALLADLPGVGDRHRRLGAERLEQARVLLGELGGALLVGEVEVAEDLAAHPQRHPQERAHVRVVAGKPDARGRARGRPRAGSGPRGSPRRAARALRQVAYPRDLLVADADGDEVGQLGVLGLSTPMAP
jgi:hypothetical protein